MDDETYTEPDQSDAAADPAQPVEPEGSAPVVHGRDPVERWLLGVVALVLVVFVALAGSLVVYVLSMRDAPRTAAEREIATDEAAVKQQPQNIENWARLALSYAKAERWSEAADALARGRVVRKAAILDVIEGDVLMLKGDAPAAIKSYDEAITVGTTEYEQAAAAMKAEKGVTVPMPSPLLFSAMRGRALALSEVGRTEEALDQAMKALDWDDTDSDLHVAMGDMYAKLGRAAEAEASYRQAMLYIPGYKPAVDGLKRIGKEQ